MSSKKILPVSVEQGCTAQHHANMRNSFFRININRIHHDKHGSDSMSYDNQGRFRPHAFEEFFDNYDRGNKDGLNMGDIYYAWLGQRLVFDFFGWSAMFLECELCRRP